eukprot:CAMPEP_0194214888 /NCGR_PEP_ID=MMETSP0156-20130528/16300_1 /TAXON_ID=33649 /ORGANISM="Thalassionema nitzschioides, Strain L26-B" /LENGTH=254 /DNA_ID=CAMNT_0038943249 /DNA_START=68 /DNA_END=829 /DNA_ORIENTATION=+
MAFTPDPLFQPQIKGRIAQLEPSLRTFTSSRREQEFSLPWTDFQDWALRDNVNKYLVSVPRPGASKPHLYGLWRSLSREVVELSGYPADHLRERYEAQQKQNEASPDNLNNSKKPIPDILPLLDEYEFEPSGGLSGRVYGIPGVAEGSKIETTSLRDVQTTVPQGYVLTDEVVYELGSPLRTPDSLDGAKRPSIFEAGESFASNALSLGGEAANKAANSDGDLIRLGGLTGILLAGATAVGMLSHHLTVNVFWV